MKGIPGIKQFIMSRWALSLAALTAIITTIIVFQNVHQPLLEQHSFRQTQTALSSYWMIEEGRKLAYETPVGGYPWSIPFEFPFYQGVVSSVSSWFGIPLDAAGRTVSFCFLLACVFPVLAIAKRLKLKRDVAWVFCSLLWSSPLYLFWGRTYMIETTAVFLTLSMIVFGIDLLDKKPKFRSALLFLTFASLGALQKATTTGPVMIVFAIVILIHHLNENGIRLMEWRKMLYLVISFAIPFALVLLWTNYTDIIKNENAFGATLTSEALSQWNYGTLSQRLNFDHLLTIFGKRVLLYNIGGPIGILVFLYAFFFAKRNVKKLIMVCLAMFLLPILIFFNLHAVHNYYQVASTLFLIAALSVGLMDAFPDRFRRKIITPSVVFLLIVFNLLGFQRSYGKMAGKEFNITNNRTLAISDVIRRYTSENSSIVVFGNNWSSNIAYYSERKSFTVPSSFEDFDNVWENPASYLGESELGAIVFIEGGSRIDLEEFIKKEDLKLNSGVFQVYPGCYVWLSNVTTIVPSSKTAPAKGFYVNLYNQETLDF